MTMMIVVSTIGFTSCSKEEISNPTNVGSVQTNVAKKGDIVDPELPTGKTVYLFERPDIKDYIESTVEFNQMNSTEEVELDSAKVIYYGNTDKITVMFPTKKDYNRFYCFLLKGMELYLCKQVELTGTEDYLNQMPERKLFSNMDIPWSGEARIYSINGDLENIINVDNGNAKPKWTPHGGFATWTDCVEHYGSQWWAIMGGFLCPGPIVVGLAVGCL